MRRKLQIALLVVCLICLGAVAGLGIRAALIADDAEHNLMAARCIARSLEGYVRNEGKWPESFDALEPYVQSRIYRWPDDREEILTRVDVDFDLTIEDVAASKSPHRFIEYQKPMFERSFEDDLERVVNVARQRLEKDRAP